MPEFTVKLAPNNFVIGLGENTVMAARESAKAEVSRMDAAESAAYAESMTGPTFANPAAGLAATTDGQGFAVDNGDGTVTVYINANGSAVEQRKLATTAYLASSNGADAVGASQEVEAEPGSLLSRFQNELYVTDAPFNAVGDGSTNNNTAITAAVANALMTGRDLFWPEGDYLTTASIANFHDVKHLGPGRIKRGSDTWYITPTGTQTNIIYVGSPNLNANDGLSSSEATNISTAFSRMRGIGDKAQNGQWRIQMLAGTFTSSGISLPVMPAFRNRLQVWGADVALTAVPTTIWDGAASAPNYAIRGDWSNNVASVFLHFKNIKFINWDNTDLSGGIVIWAAGDVLSENIHADNCSIGEWYRQCYVRSIYGTISNAATYGVAVQYGASGNIGNLSGGGKTFTNCADCVSIGRNTTAYIQGCDLSGANLISVTRNSRIRTQGNTFRAWTNSAVYAQAVGVWTPDNGQGAPDTYVMTPTDSAPVMRCENGSVHTLIHRFDGSINSFNSNGSVATISGASGVQTALSTAPGVVAGDFTPARVPAWWAYSPTASLDVEIFIILAANAGGTLALHGNTPNATGKLAEITIPAIASARSGKVRLKFLQRPGASSGRYLCEYITTGGFVGFGSSSSSNLDTSSVRSPSEGVLNFRLYWTPADNNETKFADMVARITA